MRIHSASSVGLSTVLFLFGCSKERPDEQPGSAPPAGSAEAATKPAPFDKGPVKIALVQYSGAGDYFQLWTEGAKKQADAVGFTMQHYDAQAQDAKQAADMKTAIASGVAGIIVDHGTSPTLCPLINQATDAGIAVVVYDVKVAECAPKAVETAQNDVGLATLVLTQMAKDIGDGVPVGYVNPMVIAPLERRDVVWKQFVSDHKWSQKFSVGKFSHEVAKDNAKLASAALKKHPDVKAVFASARETACRVAAGAIARKVLGPKIAVTGYLVQIGADAIDRARLDPAEIEKNPFWCPDAEAAARWEAQLLAVRKAGSSVGAVVEVVASGVPAGLGEPVYDKLDADLAKAMMSINAVKGVEIGSGFAAAALRGEDNADEIRTGNDGPRFLSNHAGGILGGISSGQDIVVRFAVKPTSSILTPRRTIDRHGNEREIVTKGRHDPCVGIRAVPVGEAMMACVLADHLLRHRGIYGASALSR
jgi:ABC-type sugar transport system substrate-binding protein